jgi:hypothetical protein
MDDKRRRRGLQFGRHFIKPNGARPESSEPNPLETYFEQHREGPGVWKWRHYFEIYHRHFQKFVGREVHVVEVGVYSGGSLAMWKDYFGRDCRVYGVDIEPACRAFEDDQVQIFIGDQGDPEFWSRFVSEVPAIDVVIDDGSHEPEHQIVTLEALLPHVRPGGVYLCEDALKRTNPFHDYIDGFSRNLHEPGSGTTYERRPTDFQRTVQAVHLHPWVTVIEKRDVPLDSLSAPKHGSEWAFDLR